MDMRAMTDFNVDHNLGRDRLKLNRYKVHRNLLRQVKQEGEKYGLNGSTRELSSAGSQQGSVYEGTKGELVMRSWRELLDESQVVQLNQSIDVGELYQIDFSRQN